ncbi:MAG: endo-1,3-alpha-glucanase family glycosylhydrolase [Acidimicrobiales bacterium]
MSASSRSVAQRSRALALGVALVLLAAACDKGTGSQAESTTTVVTTSPTTIAPTTSTTVAATTTTVSETTTTTSPSPPTTIPGGGSLTLTDTGFTRVRVSITNQAQWATITLHGTSPVASKIISTTGNSQVTALGGQDIAVHGDGTAVVDLVLSIAPGAATFLSMCKNYLGRATLDVHRLTDGDVPIASFSNTGIDPTSSPSRCENYAESPLDRAALIGPVRWPARHDPRPLVLANYYPWYDPATLNRTFGPDAPIGPADSSDPTVVAQAVDLARGSGIDGFVVEYEATPANDPRIDYVYAAAEQRTGFQVALTLDIDLIYRRNGQLSNNMLDAALGSAASHASSPSQLRVGDRPVVFVYGVSRVTNQQWSGALDRLRGRTGVQPFVISNDPGLNSDAHYLYNTYNLTTLDQLTQWASGTLLQQQLQPGLAGQTGSLWVAPASPGYDDRLVNRPDHSFVSRDGGRRYDQSWQTALTTLPDWVLIATWNEYSEQTHIAPGSTTGYQALDQTTAWAQTFHATG